MARGFSGRERVLLVVIFVLGFTCLGLLRSWSNAVQPSAVIRRFSQIWIDSETTWPFNRWLGVLTQQNPNDVWITQEILSEVKPDFVIETGTYLGGSAALWAMVLDQVNPDARVITIDIQSQQGDAPLPPIVDEKVDFLIGSSTDPAIVKQVAQRVAGKKVVVILDSDHSKNHVLAEMKAYAPLVSASSYLIVQDSNVNGHPARPDFGPGPYEAIEEFLASNHEFEVDGVRERLLFTMHPRGYLKRVAGGPAEARQ